MPSATTSFPFPTGTCPACFASARTRGGGNIGHVFGLDGTDERSITRGVIAARKSLLEYQRYYQKYLPGFEQMELVATAAQLGVRETRRIMGDYVLNLEDFKSRASFPDEIGRYSYAVDIHAAAAGFGQLSALREGFPRVALRQGRKLRHSVPQPGAARASQRAGGRPLYQHRPLRAEARFA